MSHAKRIATRPINPQLQSALQAAGANPLIAQLYAARNVADSSELNTSLTQLIPYTQRTNCTAAASRLADAIQAKQKILIIADYDADGATACSVAMKGLASMGAVVDFFVPNRFEHGYGLTPELADIAHAKGADLIVTVDNGISSAEGVARAKELGLDVIVTDHHIAGSVIPDCIIVNPNQRGCTFPSKSIAGVGVIFYVLIALRAELRQRGYFSGCPNRAEPKLDELLDLVALGTVADVVALDHNNRILVSQGLKRIRAGKMSHGIRALFQTARCSAQKAQPFDFGYKIAPRINAAGRLDDMSIGIACLLSGSLNEAESMASELNDLNQTRQEIEQEMLTDILADCPSALPSEQTTLCVYRDSFHQGVVGIVASRLKEKFYRPVFVFAPDDEGNDRGSGRSISGVDLRDVSALQPVISAEELLEMRKMLPQVVADERILHYITGLVEGTRTSPLLDLGASPRATVALLRCAKAAALLAGRDFVIPDDVKAVAPAVLCHRLSLTPDAEMNGYTAKRIVDALLESTEIPQ